MSMAPQSSFGQAGAEADPAIKPCRRCGGPRIGDPARSRTHRCVPCSNAQMRDYYAALPAEVREGRRARQRARRADDPKGTRDYFRQRYWRLHDESKSKGNEYIRRRFFWYRAVRLHGPDRPTPQELAALWKLQRGRCALTGCRLDRSAHLDHKLPRTRGGRDNIENLQWAAPLPNLAKRALTDPEFIALCREVVECADRRPVPPKVGG
jgi:5-methylcytosine-specific restriction endonuclease McrA